MKGSSPTVDPCNEAGVNATIVVKLYYSIVASTFNPYLRPNSGILNTCILGVCLGNMIIQKFLKHTVFLISYLQTVLSLKWPHLPLC